MAFKKGQSGNPAGKFHFFAFSPNSTSWDFKGAGIKATQNQRTGAFELKAGHNSKSRPGGHRTARYRNCRFVAGSIA